MSRPFSPGPSAVLVSHKGLGPLDGSVTLSGKTGRGLRAKPLTLISLHKTNCQRPASRQRPPRRSPWPHALPRVTVEPIGHRQNQMHHRRLGVPDVDHPCDMNSDRSTSPRLCACDAPNSMAHRSSHPSLTCSLETGNSRGVVTANARMLVTPQRPSEIRPKQIPLPRIRHGCWPQE